MDYHKLILIFAAVVKHGSMNAAAAHLGMTTSAISQHLRNLELHYQIKLMHRTTRKLYLTDAGKLLFQHAEKLEKLSNEIEQSMLNLRSEPEGEVRISLPSGFMKSAALARCLQKINTDYPLIRIVLLASDRYVNLIDENIDIALRVGDHSGQLDTIERLLARWKLWICASPEYLAKKPIQKIVDLYHADWLNPHEQILYNMFAALDLPHSLPPNRIDCLYSVESSTMLALAGLGVTVALEGEISAFVEQGRLTVLFPDVPLREENIYAVTAHRNYSAKVAKVLTVLKEGFAEK
ncbi:hypothetical protein QS62_08575 [Gallibacterium salpingitidis]|uniref:HTH lysR-type domain-containing protein n=2 Tax=Gallibacterium salpingitidis TaxID=505341 RepID=A0A1A7NR84_9PAST|nr:hypothetical protein QS62_08575 [Gallibacterium salpingitidis]